MDMKNIHYIIIAVLGILVLLLLARYVVFDEQFEEWGEGVERIGEWEENYRTENPNATDAEVDAAFEAGIAEMDLWIESYKRENPGATDAEAEAALGAALEAMSNN